jgi:predicted negative regulator of RcsB-dependent stress response
MPKRPVKPIKLSRRDLNQPSEFLTFGDRAKDFFKAYAQPLGLACAGILVVVLAVIGIRQYRAHQDQLAAESFYQAFIALQDRRYLAAEERFRELARNQPRRKLGRLANFYLAVCYLEQGQLKQARAALIDTLANLKDPLFRSMALMDLGSLYEQTGDLARAQEAYREASALRSSADNLDAELALARIEAERGNKRAAIEAYQGFLKKHPYAPQRQDVLEALASLGTTPTSSGPTTGAKTAASH